MFATCPANECKSVTLERVLIVKIWQLIVKIMFVGLMPKTVTFKDKSPPTCCEDCHLFSKGQCRFKAVTFTTLYIILLGTPKNLLLDP